MSRLVIEDLDDDVRIKLKELAHDHGRSLAD
jgi:plasmid stability protein